MSIHRPPRGFLNRAAAVYLAAIATVASMGASAAVAVAEPAAASVAAPRVKAKAKGKVTIKTKTRAIDTVTTRWNVTPPASSAATAQFTLDATVFSARTARVQNLMINVRNQTDEAFPVGLRRDATLGPVGTRIAGTRAYPPGSYRYRVGYLQNGVWRNVGTIRTFEVGAPAPAPAPAPATPSRWVTGYYVGYLVDDYPLSAVEWDAMTHVAVGAAVPRVDGTLDASFFRMDDASGRAWAKGVVDRAHQHGRKAIMMLGGADSRRAFASATSPQYRDAFVTNILATATSLGFDGVDIDWEPMQAVDGPAVLWLGRELKTRRPGLLLTIPVGTVNMNRPQDTVFPITAELSSVFDQVNIMSYGMNGAWQDWQSWHSSALYGESLSSPMSVDSSVRTFLAAGVPARKLGIGIGFYGSCMTGVTQPRQLVSGMRLVGDDNLMSFANIMTKYYEPAKVQWDAVARVPYLSSTTPMGPAGCTYVTYEDERSIAEKAAFVKAKGLGGAIIWNINEGNVAAPTISARTSAPSLMTAVRQGFLD